MKELSNTEADFQKCVAYKKKPVIRPEGHREPRNEVDCSIQDIDHFKKEDVELGISFFLCVNQVGIRHSVAGCNDHGTELCNGPRQQRPARLVFGAGSGCSGFYVGWRGDGGLGGLHFGGKAER